MPEPEHVGRWYATLSSPLPADGATNQETDTVPCVGLTWGAWDCPGWVRNWCCRSTLAFGDVNPPEPVLSGHPGDLGWRSGDGRVIRYDPGPLKSNTTYYWQLTVENRPFARIVGPIWSFTTKFVPFAPTTAPTVTPVAGPGLAPGCVYQYAFTDVTASGESLPSPLATILTTVLVGTSDPVLIGSMASPWGPYDTNSGFSGGVTFEYAYTFRRLADDAETGLSPARTVGPTGDATGYCFGVTLAGCDSAPAGWVRQWYRTENGGSTFKRIPVGSAITGAPTMISGAEGEMYFLDHTADDALGVDAPATNDTAARLQMALSNVAIGPTGTTARNVYRTEADGSQLRLLNTIANNSSTDGGIDTASDGTLGADVPTVDTSGL